MAALIRDDRKEVDVKPDRLLLSARRMREEKVAFDQGGAAVEAIASGATCRRGCVSGDGGMEAEDLLVIASDGGGAGGGIDQVAGR